MGLKRIAWMKRISEVGFQQAGGDPLPTPEDFKLKREPKFAQLSECFNTRQYHQVIVKDCTDSLHDKTLLAEWVESESWLVDRYELMLERAAWRDQPYFDIDMPIPSFGRAMEAQKLLLAKMALLNSNRQPAMAKSLLEQDIRFWRRVLISTNMLITKMVATAALTRHFEVTNILLNSIDPISAHKMFPGEWQQTIGTPEYSMKQVMIGEWVYVSSVFRKLKRVRFEGNEGVWRGDLSMLQRWAQELAVTLYQPQETINEIAARYMQIATATTVDCKDLEASLSAMQAHLDDEFSSLWRLNTLYNPMGKISTLISPPDFSRYPARVADIEGVRRATLAAFELRAASIAPTDVAEALKKSEFRNPYSNDPFEWDKESKAIVFKGLEAGDRGVHRVYY